MLVITCRKPQLVSNWNEGFFCREKKNVGKKTLLETFVWVKEWHSCLLKNREDTEERRKRKVMRGVRET